MPADPRTKDTITLAHGSGGRLMHELVDRVFMSAFSNRILTKKADAARVGLGGRDLAFTTDTFVVKPLFFSGGDIGKLAVAGTVNDLAVSGARPAFISCALVIEEGFDVATLKRVIASMAKTARRAGVSIVTGDTKVVGRGACDGLFINTSGIGLMRPGIDLSADRIKPGDALIVSGTVGDHAISVLAEREGLSFGTSAKSDAAPLNGLIDALFGASRRISFMRDPTRGGLAAVLNEITEGRRFGIRIDEEKVPVSAAVSSACELLGLDPLALANEGKVVVVVPQKDASKVLLAMRRHPLGRRSKIIGLVDRSAPGRVWLATKVGGKRLLDMPAGESIPRIC